MNENIPEWKRGALTVSDQTETEEKKGVFRRMSGKVKEKISSTESAQKFYQSENYQKIQGIKETYSEFKSKLNEQIEETQNPVVQGTRRIADIVMTESSCARAIKEMQKYDPTFDL